MPERGKLLHRTLRSLGAAGFEGMQLFVDEEPRLGAFGRWTLAVWEMYVRQPHAERYAVFQDDCEACSHLREYLEGPVPERGYLNLYTAKLAVLHATKPGWNRSSQRGKGAVGLVFTNAAVRTLLASPTFVAHPRDSRYSKVRIDGTIVQAMNAAGWAEYIHEPSLVQHTSTRSTLSWWAGRRSPCWPGASYDPRGT